jgi:hypothetical protein
MYFRQFAELPCRGCNAPLPIHETALQRLQSPPSTRRRRHEGGRLEDAVAGEDVARRRTEAPRA